MRRRTHRPAPRASLALAASALAGLACAAPPAAPGPSGTPSSASTSPLAGAPAPAEVPPPVPRAELTMSAADAPTPAGARLIELLRELDQGVRETRYQARTVVRPRDGYYAWDCSGMAAWLMKRTAPRALRAVGGGRPVASDFYRAIDAAPVERARRGWQRVPHVSQARPGDAFAWLRSPLSTSAVTGHVGFVVGPPREVPDWPGAWAVRIVDATGLPHQDDTRPADGGGGFGFGTMLFVTDDTGEVTAYGWFGTASSGLMPARVIFGRPTG
ncbi:MAG: CHAP domain-containing protein [Myxococcales bacterium]|nr:CHAP domain-containing protein [Myxococcales bacterium]